jgi:hypothetical protein
MRRTRPTLRVCVSFALFIFAVTLSFPVSSYAQKRKPIPSGPPKPPTPDTTIATPNLRTADQAALEMSVLMSRRIQVSDLEREQRRLIAQLAQDLEQLQRVNKEQLSPLMSATSTDFKTLGAVSAEIKSRAMRIKFNSPITLIDRTGEKIKYEPDAEKVATLIPTLSRLITSFVNNPVFRISSPDDMKQRSEAAHDLEGIIKLSDAIGKIAKRMSRPLVAAR